MVILFASVASLVIACCAFERRNSRAAADEVDQTAGQPTGQLRGQSGASGSSHEHWHDHSHKMHEYEDDGVDLFNRSDWIEMTHQSVESEISSITNSTYPTDLYDEQGVGLEDITAILDRDRMEIIKATDAVEGRRAPLPHPQPPPALPPGLGLGSGSGSGSAAPLPAAPPAPPSHEERLLRIVIVDAESGSAEAQSALGYCYATGRGVEQNEEMVTNLF